MSQPDLVSILTKRWRNTAIGLALVCFGLICIVAWQWRVIYQVDEWNQVQNRASWIWEQETTAEKIEGDLTGFGFRVDKDSGNPEIDRRRGSKFYRFFGYPLGGYGEVIYVVKDGKVVQVKTKVRMKTF